jgi:sarcosine oxidase subunit beta
MSRAETGQHPRPPDLLWRNPEPRRAYDVVIVGAGGHGLATAYYLAALHGIRSVAVVERGYLAGGNMGRNTTVIRSNYLWDESAAIYEHSLRLWENLEAELDYDFQFRQVGVYSLAHSPAEVRATRRRVNANILNGVDGEWLEPAELQERIPLINVSTDVRYPILGAALQRRGGTARHDSVAWAYARAASALGVDLIQGCRVTDILAREGRVEGVETSLGTILAPRVALAAAGHSSLLAAMVGLELPIQSHPLQALVSDLMEPLFDGVVMSNAVHVYLSQAPKGELVIGAGIDAYNSYAQRGSFHVIERQIAAVLELFPNLARVHVLRTWAGIVDVCPDASPILGLTPIQGLYLNCGWGTGGFKATPGSGWVFADTIANDRPHPLAMPFALDRFTTGALIDEHGAAGVSH